MKPTIESWPGIYTGTPALSTILAISLPTLELLIARGGLPCHWATGKRQRLFVHRELVRFFANRGDDWYVELLERGAPWHQARWEQSRRELYQRLAEAS